MWLHNYLFFFLEVHLDNYVEPKKLCLWLSEYCLHRSSDEKAKVRGERFGRFSYQLVVVGKYRKQS